MSERITINEEERRVLLECIRIAAEDGSIYGGYDDPAEAEFQRIDRLLDGLEKKLRGDRP